MQNNAAGNSQATVVYTIGHSNLPVEEWLSILLKLGMEILIDVRSVPYSRYAPQANREPLEEVVLDAGIDYIFMGVALGGRPKDEDACDVRGEVSYSRQVKTFAFTSALTGLLDEASRHTVCLLCSEEDPSRCHRGLLIGEELSGQGTEVRHIRGDGSIETQAEMRLRLSGGQMSLF